MIYNWDNVTLCYDQHDTPSVKQKIDLKRFKQLKNKEHLKIPKHMQTHVHPTVPEKMIVQLHVTFQQFP